MPDQPGMVERAIAAPRGVDLLATAQLQLVIGVVNRLCCPIVGWQGENGQEIGAGGTQA